MEENPIKKAQDSAVDVRSSLSQMHKELMRMERRKPSKHKQKPSIRTGPLLAPPGLTSFQETSHQSPQKSRIECRRRVLRNVLRRKVKRDAKLAVRSVLAGWSRNTAQWIGRTRMEQRVANELDEVEKEQKFMRRLETAMDDLYSGLAEDLKPRSPPSLGVTQMLPESSPRDPNDSPESKDLFAAWGSLTGEMGPGATPVNPRLRATRSLLQVMAHTNRNSWLGDKMRQDRYNMPIPEYHTVEIQATAEVVETGMMAVAQSNEISIQTMRLDHRMVGLTKLYHMNQKESVMMTTKCMLQFMANYSHRKAMKQVAAANDECRQHGLKMTVARLMIGCIRNDVKMFSVCAIMRFIDRSRARQFTKLLMRWRARLAGEVLQEYNSLKNTAEEAVQKEKDLRKQLIKQKSQIFNQQKTEKQTESDKKKLLEMEMSLKGTRKSSIAEAAKRFKEGHAKGQRKAATRTLTWGIYNFYRAHLTPAALRAIVSIWLARAQVDKIVARSLKDVKTHAARNISRLKSDVKATNNKLDVTEAESEARRRSILAGCSKMLERALKGQDKYKTRLLISKWRSRTQGGVQAQLEQALRVAEQLEAQLQAKNADHGRQLQEINTNHQAALEAKQQEIDALEKKQEFALQETRLDAKRQGQRQRTMWAIDRMLHQQSKIGISPTALTFYIANWSANTSKHCTARDANLQKEQEMASQATTTRQMTKSAAVRVLRHCKQRQHEAKRHALIHRWYVNMAEYDRETAVKGYKAGKARLARELDVAKNQRLVALMVNWVSGYWKSRCNLALNNWRIRMGAQLLEASTRSHRDTIRRADRERAAVMTLNLMMRFRRVWYTQLLATWRVAMMDGDFVKMQRGFEARSEESVTEVRNVKQHSALCIWKYIMHWWDGSLKLRTLRNWAVNGGVGRKVVIIDKLSDALKHEKQLHLAQTTEMKEERLAHAVIRIWHTFRVKKMSGRLVSWRTQVKKARAKSDILRKNAAIMLEGVNKVRKLAFLSAARSIAEWRVGTRCGDRMGKVSVAMSDALASQVEDLSAPKKAMSAKGQAKLNVAAAKAKMDAVNYDLEQAQISGDPVLIERAQRKKNRAEKAVKRRNEELQFEKRKELDGATDKKKKVKEPPIDKEGEAVAASKMGEFGSLFNNICDAFNHPPGETEFKAAEASLEEAENGAVAAEQQLDKAEAEVAQAEKALEEAFLTGEDDIVRAAHERVQLTKQNVIEAVEQVKTASKELLQAEEAVESIEQLQQDPMAAIRNMTNKLMRQYAQAERCAESRRVQLTHIRRAARIMVGAGVLLRSRQVQSLVRGWRSRQQLCNANCLVRMLRLQSGVQSRQSLAELNIVNAQATLQLSAQYKKVDRFKAKLKVAKAGKIDAENASQESLAKAVKANDAMAHKQAQIEQVMELQAQAVKKALKLQNKVHKTNFQRILARFTARENYRTMSQLLTHQVVNIARGHKKLNTADGKIEKARILAEKSKKEIADLRSRSEKIAIQRDKERDKMVEKMVALREAKEGMEKDHDKMVQARKEEITQKAELEANLKNQMDQKAALESSLAAMQGELASEQAASNEMMLARFKLRIQSTLNNNRDQFTTNMLAVRCWLYQMEIEKVAAQQQEGSNLLGALKVADNYHVATRKAGMQCLLNMWSHRAHAMELYKAKQKSLVAVAVVSIQKYWISQQGSAITDWKINSKVPTEEEKLMQMQDWVLEAEQQFETKLRSAQLQHQEETERIEECHDHTLAMVKALSSVLDQDHWFSITAHSAISNWRVAYLCESSEGCSVVELDKLKFEVEQLEEQLVATREINRELAGEKGLDVLLGKVEQLQAEAVECGKRILEAQHEKEKTQVKLKKALEQIRKMKDGLPPDVKLMAAAFRQHALVRSRGILVNWETNLLSRLLMVWQLRCGGLMEMEGMFGFSGARTSVVREEMDSAGSAFVSEDPEAQAKRLEQQQEAEEKANAAKKQMEEEAERARLAEEEEKKAQEELQAAIERGDTAAVEAAQAKLAGAQKARAQAQESLSNAQNQLSAAEKDVGAAKVAAPKKSPPKRSGKSSMVAQIVQKKCMGLFALLTTILMVQRQRGQWLVLLVWRWRLKTNVNRAVVAASDEMEMTMKEQLKLVKQTNDLCQAELESKTEELEAARQSRLKFRNQCMRLKRQVAQTMVMVWMMIAKDQEERASWMGFQAIRRWMLNFQMDKLHLLTQTATQAAADNIELNKQNEELQQQLTSEQEQSEADRAKFQEQIQELETEQQAREFQAAEQKLQLEQEVTNLIEQRERQVREAVEAHASQMKLCQLMTGIMTARIVQIFSHVCLRSIVANWMQNHNLSLLYEVRDAHAKTLERARKMSKQTVVLEQQNANFKHVLEQKNEKIQQLATRQTELETETIPQLNSQIKELKAAEQQMIADHQELKVQSHHYKTWLGIKLAASIILKVMVIRKAEWLRAAKSNWMAHKVGTRISPVMMSLLLSAREDRIWCARLALPFIHWHEVSSRRILSYRLKRQVEKAEKSKEHSEAMQLKVEVMEAEQAKVLADLRNQVQNEVKVLHDKIEEQQKVIAKKVEERDTHIRRMTKQHHEIQDLNGEIALEQRRRLYAALITMRNFFWKRAIVVTLERWRSNLIAVMDPDSARNQLQLALAQVKQLAEEIKRMQSHSEVSHKGGAQSVKQVQMMQQRDKMMRARGKQVFALLIFSLWNGASRWQLHSLKKCWQLWHLTARSCTELKRATAMLQQQQQNLSGGMQQQRELVKQVEMLQEQAADLIQVCTHKDEELRLVEERLFQNKKDSETKVKQLEESFLDAIQATALNRELLADKDHDLEITRKGKNEAIEVIEDQERTIAEQKKMEAKLTELYDKASTALKQETGHSAVFTAAVLKAHYLTCKLFSIVKLAKGGRTDIISPDNLPLTNGVDVIRQDELMLREVYHWIKRVRQQDKAKHLNAGVAPVLKTERKPVPAKAPQYAPIEYVPPVEKATTPAARTPLGPRTEEEARPVPFKISSDMDIFEKTTSDDVQIASPVHTRTFKAMDEWAEAVTSPQRGAVAASRDRADTLPVTSSLISPPAQPTLDPLATRIHTPETPTFEGNKFNALPSINTSGVPPTR